MTTTVGCQWVEITLGVFPLYFLSFYWEGGEEKEEGVRVEIMMVWNEGVRMRQAVGSFDRIPIHVDIREQRRRRYKVS